MQNRYFIHLFLFFFFALPLSTFSEDDDKAAQPIIQPPELAKSLQEAVNQAAQLDQILSGQISTHHPLDIFRLLEQTVEGKGEARFLGPHDLMVHIENQKQQVAQAILFSTHGKKSSSWIATEDEVYTFEIVKKNGFSLHRFTIPVRQVMAFGDFLVFCERESYNGKNGFHSISFIDLHYFQSSLGKAALPVFRFPVKTGDPNSVLREENGKLFFGEVPLGNESISSSQVLEQLSGLQQVAFHITANLSDPDTYESGQELVQDFEVLLNRHQEDEGQEANLRSQVARLIGPDDESFFNSFRNHFQEAETAGSALSVKQLSGFDKKLQETKALQETIASITEAHVKQRQVRARIGLMLAHLTAPVHDGANKILSGFAWIAGGLRKKDKSESSESAWKHFRRYAKYGLGVMAAGWVAFHLPYVGEPMAHWTFESLSLMNSMFTSVLGPFWSVPQEGVVAAASPIIERAWDVDTLTHVAVQRTFQFLDGESLYNMYVANGRFPKLLVGMSAAFGMLFTAVGLPHFIINTWKLIDDFKHKKELQVAQDFSDKLIVRQNLEEERFFQNLSSKKKEQESDGSFTAEEEEAIQEKITFCKTKYRSVISKLGLSFKKSSEKITSLMGAITHFLFSSASFTHSGHFYIKIWNSFWFPVRSFMWKPTIWTAFLFYPNYFSTVLGEGGEPGSLPTIWNGGLRPFYQEISLRVSKIWGNESLEALRKWEAQVIPIEQEIHAEVLRQTFSALVEYIPSDSEAVALFEEGKITSITDPRIQKLSFRSKQFFNLFYKQLFDLSMEEYIRKILQDASISCPSGASCGSEAMKQLALLENISPQVFNLSENIKQMVQRVKEESKVFQTTVSKLDSFMMLPERLFYSLAKMEPLVKNFSMGIMGVNFAGILTTPHLRLYNVLDPKKNRQMARIQTVRKQEGNPSAMARAVRAVRASFIVDKPMELILQFLLLAGVTAGISVPLHDEMFSEDALFYLGRYPFFTGYAVGIIMGVPAEIWIKLQIDELHEGHFEDVPAENDKNVGYFHWFLKKFFQKSEDKAKDNSLLNNHLHNSKIIWANMAAALATYLVMHLPTLQRFDLDMYVVGYIFAYVIPFPAMANKIEQAFDMSSYWFAKHFTKKELEHPRVQRYLNERIQEARIGFNFVYKLFYENTFGFVISNLQTLNMSEFGPRSLSRALFGGYMLTEHAVGGLTYFKEHLGFLPGVNRAADACTTLLTNLNKDAIRLPEVLETKKK